jgi:dTDP-4-dehydrorhamnose 3,5-epimerase
LIVTPTRLEGAFIVDPDVFEDERGSFSVSFCRARFAAHGLDTAVAQCASSFNHRRGTLRGLHYQKAPFEQTRLVSCSQGAIFDVIVDIRPGSPTLRAWFAAELSAANRRMLYVPRGFAHGYLTLEDGSVVQYQLSETHHPESEAGIRWDDPLIGIRWPAAPVVISARDRGHPPLPPGPSAPSAS